MTVNDRLHDLINALDLNPNSFAESIGVKSTVIYNIIKGRRSKPSFDVLQKIFITYKALNVAWLLKGDGRIWLEKPSSIEKVEVERVKLDEKVMSLIDSLRVQLQDEMPLIQLEELIQKLVDENNSQKAKIANLYEKQEQILDVIRNKLSLDI